VKSRENDKSTKRVKATARLEGHDSKPIAAVNRTPKKELAAEWVETKAIAPWEDNPRRNDANVQRVADSIRRFGFGAPILARRENGEIIAGHTRLKAAVLLGLDRVPVRYLDLDPADARLLALADNRLGEFSEWDEDKLSTLLGELRQQGTDAALVAGWSDAEIDSMLKAASGAPVPTEFKEYDESVAEDVKTVSCPHCGGTVPV